MARKGVCLYVCRGGGCIFATLIGKWGVNGVMCAGVLRMHVDWLSLVVVSSCSCSSSSSCVAHAWWHVV